MAGEIEDPAVEEQVLYEEDGPVAFVTFNREDKLNAMNSAVQHRLIELFDRIDRSDGVRVAVLTGRGRAFVAGADIGEYAGQSPAEFSEYQSRGRRMYEGIERNRKPFIAAVNGYALGGGFEIVLACDLVVASREAEMGLPEVHLGLLPGGGGTQRLARIVGRNLAKEFLMTGRNMTAEEGHRLGVVNRVVEGETLLDEALELARKLARRAPFAVREAKQLVNQGVEAPVDLALSYEQATLSNLYQTADASEGIRAFVEKRRPDFRGE
ncbi:MAG: enoyl-CoA hydratase/isomerase family protein [Rubrobacter sp.]